MFCFVFSLILISFIGNALIILWSLVLKKSQKETSILIEQNCKGKGTNVQDQGNFNKLSKSESDLTGHWRSLFIHMEDILARESNQLVSATFVPLA